MTTHHLEETLERDISHLRVCIQGMAGLANRALETCVEALQNRNRKLAFDIILRDQRIDEMEKEVDRVCLEFLIRHQPVGTQLRFVYAAIKINAELERIGDYAESIARQIAKTSGLAGPPTLAPFMELAGLSIPMLRDAVTAYLDQNADLARHTMEAENRADEIRNRIDAELVRHYQDGRIPLESMTRFMTIARRFERVSDQAKNICEETLYVCTGDFAKHRGAGTWRILFVDEHSACLAPMACAIGRALGHPRFEFDCAGLSAGPSDPFTRSFLAGKKLEARLPEPQSLEQVSTPERVQLMIELGRLSRPIAPAARSKAILLQWGAPDPTGITGTPEEVHALYEEAFLYLSANIRDLVDAVLGDNPA